MKEDQLKKPESQSFVKFDMSIIEELNRVSPLDEKMRHIVPPQVAALQEQLKNDLQGSLNHHFELVNQQENATRGFLSQNGLPQALHSICSTDIPDQMWVKIEDFQKKGAMTQFQNLIDTCNAMKASNNHTLSECQSKLQKEEDEDEALRKQYGSGFSRLPSNAVNIHYK